MSHVPVLLNESIEALSIQPSGTYVDATYGGGGHAKQILSHLSENGQLVVFDQDEDVRNRLLNDERITLVNENFRHLKRFLRFHGIQEVHGILADLGMSSFQLDSESRGFATRFDATLDMRMKQSASLTAADVLNQYDAEQLQLLLQNYGEVRNARSLAQHVVAERSATPFERTDQFIHSIEGLIKGNRNRYLAQVFQALRIEVNDEINALKELLEQGAELLAEGGRFVIISFHSLEDRLVKRFFKTGSFDGQVEKDVFGRYETPLTMVSRKPIEASEEEKEKNPRARSAKLRIAKK